MRIMGVAMHQGRGSALALAAGVISGSFFWGSVAATGVAALLTEYAQALVILKVAGGAYLLWLALKAARSTLASEQHLARTAAATPHLSAGTLYRRGLLMHLTNPKALLGWAATMTLGLGPDASSATVAVILGGCAMLSVTIFCGYALVFSTEPMVRGYRKARRWIEGTLAFVYATAGVRLLCSRL
ncbi:LysE family translocator [Pseudomonas putida]